MAIFEIMDIHFSDDVRLGFSTRLQIPISFSILLANVHTSFTVLCHTNYTCTRWRKLGCLIQLNYRKHIRYWYLCRAFETSQTIHPLVIFLACAVTCLFYLRLFWMITPRYLYDDTWLTEILLLLIGALSSLIFLKLNIISFVFPTFRSG